MLRQALAGIAAACATASGRPAAQQRAGAALPVARVEEMLSAGLAALERGEIDASSIASNGFSWGVGARDVFTSREALARSKSLEKFTAQDLERHVYSASDGQSAWFWESYRRPERVVRHTGLAAAVDGKWLILAQHTSFAYGPDVDRKDEEGTLPELAPVGDGVASGAEEVADLFRTAVFFDRMLAAATPPDFILMGTDSGYIAGAVLRPLPRGNENGPRPKDGLRAGLGPGGLTAWAAANAVWIQDGKRTMGPMRFMFVFTRENGRWRLVQNHHSYALE